MFLSRDTYIERDAGESSNDRNDRAIRTAAKWYQDHLLACDEDGTGDKMKVVLLTNDMDNRNKATAAGITTFTGSFSVLCLNRVGNYHSPEAS